MRTIPDPGFGGDDGEVPSALSAALAQYDEDPDRRYWPTLAVLQECRILVPVMAVLGELEHDEGVGAGPALPREKTSDMAAVLMRGRDGRTALLAFTGTGPMRRWDPEARPVPVLLDDGARAARQDGAAALLVDVAGPVPFVVEEGELTALAAGQRLVRTEGGWGWARPIGRDPG